MSKESKAIQLLTIMEGIVGTVIPQQRKGKKLTLPPIGLRNKKCLGCGHKNKKCTCNSGGRNENSNNYNVYYGCFGNWLYVCLCV
ncbi:hypothetical protein LCGC14_2220320, partial [marine sediment metagenome]